MNCNKLKLGWFSTSRGGTSLKIFKYIQNLIEKNELNVEIKFVFINRDLGEGENSDKFIRYILKKRIPLITFSSKKYLPVLKQKNISLWRKKFDSEVYKLIKDFDVEIILLAGYMLILDKNLCEKRLFINLHPALPWGPKGKWDEVINQIILEKQKEHGVMIHLVTKDLDRGPVVTYVRYPIKKYDFKKIRAEGVKYELPLIRETLKLLSEDKLKIKNNCCKDKKNIDKNVYFKNKLLYNGYEINIKNLMR
ncbi:MAG: formyltransferase family protein [Endomicrobiia bacterium]